MMQFLDETVITRGYLKNQMVSSGSIRDKVVLPPKFHNQMMNFMNYDETAHKIREDISQIVKLFCLTEDRLEKETIRPTQNHKPILIPTSMDELKSYFPIDFGTFYLNRCLSFCTVAPALRFLILRAHGDHACSKVSMIPN